MLYLMHAARAAADTCVTIEIENFLISALQLFAADTGVSNARRVNDS